MDPYKILGLPRDFNEQQLKDAFKKLAITTHPDKGGNEHLFNMVVASFKVLNKELNARKSDKQYDELKRNFQRDKASPSASPMDPNNGFNLNRFNQVFQENRLATVADSGYNDWLKKDVAAPTSHGKVTEKNFNKVFDKVVTNETKDLIAYREPEALPTSKKVQYTELGLDKIDDFSGENLSRKKLNFMDLKIAHTTSRIGAEKVKRKNYQTIEDLESDRASISYKMNPEEQEVYNKRKIQEELRERQRQEIQSKLDKLTSEQYDKLHKLLLGR
jgi:curved DNA-binding protein CbpA